MATPLVFNQTAELGLLTDAIAASLDGITVDLYQNNLVYTPNVVIGDLDIATYGGYAQVTPTWDAPSVSDAGQVEAVSSQMTFRPTGSATPNQIYGYYVKNAGGALIGGGFFEGAPLPMTSTLDVIKLNMVARLTAGGIAVVIS